VQAAVKRPTQAFRRTVDLKVEAARGREVCVAVSICDRKNRPKIDLGECSRSPTMRRSSIGSEDIRCRHRLR